MIDEMVRSDAFRALTKTETDIFLYALTERRYPGKKTRKTRDHWNPTNAREYKLAYTSIRKFFSKKGYSQPSVPTIRRAFKKFMTVGFLSLQQRGGNGPGDLNVYRLEHNWRLWRKEDGPCFSDKGMAKAKGFCVPGSKRLFKAKNDCKIK